jgi:hypothetical protein
VYRRQITGRIVGLSCPIEEFTYANCAAYKLLAVSSGKAARDFAVASQHEHQHVRV